MNHQVTIWKLITMRQKGREKWEIGHLKLIEN